MHYVTHEDSRTPTHCESGAARNAVCARSNHRRRFVILSRSLLPINARDSRLPRCAEESIGVLVHRHHRLSRLANHASRILFRVILRVRVCGCV